jgi:hypothetical protein
LVGKAHCLEHAQQPHARLTYVTQSKVCSHFSIRMDRYFRVVGPKDELDAFEKLASEAGLTVQRQQIYRASTRPQQIAEALQIVSSQQGRPIVAAIAATIEAALAQKSSRRVTITTIEEDVFGQFDVRGYTTEALVSLLPNCRELLVYDGASQFRFPPPDHLQSESDLDERDIIGFERVKGETEEFEHVLNRFKIQIAPGAPLEKMCFSLLDLVSGKYTIGDTMEDLRIAYRPALGLHDLIRRVVRMQHHPDFAALVDHLRLLNTGTVVQNAVAPTDQVAAKIFELLVGLLCLETGTDTRLDGPVHSYGDNPDILTLQDRRLWGFACKVLSGRSPKTMFDRLKEGIEQIAHSPAEVGCVIINLKNQIDHDKLWPMLNANEYATGKETPTYGAWGNLRDAVKVLHKQAAECHRNFIIENGPTNVRNLLIGKKSIPGALLYLQSACQVQLVEGPGMTVLRYFYLMDEEVSAADAATFNRLNDALHHHVT